MTTPLEIILRAAAVGQLCLGVLNYCIVCLMNWRSDVGRMPLLVREVFLVHTWFISITLAIFAVLTWRFAPEIANGYDPIARWLAGAIGSFWAIRAVLQISCYSRSHWHGDRVRTGIHILLLVIYTAWAGIYLTCGFHS